jgi:hypothetical protein
MVTFDCPPTFVKFQSITSQNLGVEIQIWIIGIMKSRIILPANVSMLDLIHQEQTN